MHVPSARWMSRWEAFRFNFWFIPMIMILVTVALAAFTLWIDTVLPPEAIEEVFWIYRGRGERTLFLLTAVAGATVTVAALVFTITVVALTVASSQYGHRLLRTYITDPSNQVVTGMFICTFIYCMIVLHSAPDLASPEPTPHISVSVAGGLALVSLGLLIYYLHHASTSLQVEIFAARLGHNLIREIRRQHPEHPQAGRDDAPDARTLDAHPHRMRISSPREGYIRFIDYDRLMNLAIRHDAVIRVLHESGRFMVHGQEIAQVHAEAPLPPRLERAIHGCFRAGPMRNLGQDIRYGVDQLVEVALRALSVNAPFTAIGCLEWIGAALSMLAERERPHACLFDASGGLRIVRKTTGFDEIARSAFQQLRQFSYDVPSVSIRMLDVIALVASKARNPAYRRTLLEHARMIEEGKSALLAVQDRDDLSRRFRRVAEIAAEA